MTLVTVTGAARLARVSRGTIYNKIDSGELSKTSDGIDTTELLRVFGTLHDASTDDKPSKKLDVSDGSGALSGVMARQNDEFTKGLMEQLEQAARDKEWLQELAENREKQAQEIQTKLNETVERHAEERQTWTTKLDEMQKRLPAPEDLIPKPRKKLFGLF